MAQPVSSVNLLIDDRDQFLLPQGQVMFNDLFVPRSFKEGDKPKYSVTLVFPPDTKFDTYKQALNRLTLHPDFSKLAVTPGSPEEQKQLSLGVPKEDIVYVDEFLKRLKKAIKKETREEQLEKYPQLKGQWSVKCSATRPPAVLDAAKNPIKIDQKELIYNGCYGQALVSVGIYNGSGISLRLHAFQKQKNGTPFGRAMAKTDMFQAFDEDDYGNAESLAEEEV